MPKPIQSSTYTFRNIIEGGFLYVDKTRYLYQLIREATGIYFLSRPRRFGKSLTISTLEEIFKGSKELFKGLWIYDSEYSWQQYPVLRLDFSRNKVNSAVELEQVIDYFVAELAERYEVPLQGFDFQSRFDNLIQQLGKDRKIVILIDEYDKPILDNLSNLEEAKRIRDTLKSFYTIIKAQDANLRFVFITGISRFGRVGVFSSMNNLDDLTMDPAFATALGITESELRRDFAEHIADFAAQENSTPEALLEKIRKWYNGFCFVEKAESVYNPFSTIQLLKKQRFANYWFETGTPTFLIDLVKEREMEFQSFDELEVTELAFSTYEIERLELIPLLFQAGYLTIKDYRQDEFGSVYTLSYPNLEVRNAFLAYLLNAYNHVEIALGDSYLRRLLTALDKQDLPQFFATLDIFFANVDYDLQIDHEKYYQTIFYLIFLLLGVRVYAEVKTNRGRIDAVIEIRNRIFLFEFKLDGSADEALQQIREHEYAQKYRLSGKPLTFVGVNFNRFKRQIGEWKQEQGQA